ncbi:MAG: NAD(+) synthase [Eubacteriales bacterium]|nr:NAD(+) synthase [Eubacteriales bacterium]MDD4474511.1 NAD(+) synthase [Eubacteriales bacterium]
MKDGFLRVAAATPKIKVSDCEFNAESICEIIRNADKDCALIVFPELCVTGYTNGDLFLQNVLLGAAEKATEKIIKTTQNYDGVVIVGVPFVHGAQLFNCGAVVCKGRLLALVSKKNIPVYSEFYEMRHFTPGKDEITIVNYAGFEVPFGASQIFRCAEIYDFCFGVEISNDLWVAKQPSIELARSGALIIANLSASSDAVGRDRYKRNLVAVQSARLSAAYIYSDAGLGESSTDLVFSGHNIIAENGVILKESKKYETGTIYTDIDLSKLSYDRRRISTYDSAECKNEVLFSYKPRELKLERHFSKSPFVPFDNTDMKERFEDILNIQSVGLAQRLEKIGGNAIIGLSGGLDSALALLVTLRAFDRLGKDRSGIHCVTMPCFGTTSRTLDNARSLANVCGSTLHEIDISETVRSHLKDINHDGSHDVTFENAQARERTQVLMDLSNKLGGIVIGTGDLSELALGWATYNGDHMSMYAVNCSVPKTLVRHLVAFEADRLSGEQGRVLTDIVNTPVSPELLPPENGVISQKTEDLVGPYELHDFFLYYFLRFAYPPSKIYRIACIAFNDAYSSKVIKKWLTVFIKRFFTQQFKRSCLPDGPRVGSVALSPRGDWRMPSDASVNLWLKELEQI